MRAFDLIKCNVFIFYRIHRPETEETLSLDCLLSRVNRYFECVNFGVWTRRFLPFLSQCIKMINSLRVVAFRRFFPENVVLLISITKTLLLHLLFCSSLFYRILLQFYSTLLLCSTMLNFTLFYYCAVVFYASPSITLFYSALLDPRPLLFSTLLILLCSTLHQIVVVCPSVSLLLFLLFLLLFCDCSSRHSLIA